MFGPLPLLHRIVLVVFTLCFGVASGAWVAHMTTVPGTVSTGTLVGGLIGLAAAYALVHQPQPRAVRVNRRR
jgi:phosphate/sulfate permease